MSQEELGGGIGGDDNGGDKKGKGVLPAIPESPSSSDEEEEVDQSKATRRTTLDCLASLEESLPIKRGLSSHYSGKSKSFGNLTDLASGYSIELGKKEHRLNKRRRLLLAHELNDDNKADDQKGGMSSSMPILPSDNDPMDQNDQEDNKEDKSVNDDKNQPAKDDQK